MHFQTALPFLALFSSALAAAIPAQSANEKFIARRAVSGKSTFYGGNVQGGTCSFSTYTLPSGLYGTAFSGQAWNKAANCGGCVKVSHGGKSITAMVSYPLPPLSHLKAHLIDALSRSSTNAPNATQATSTSSPTLSPPSTAPQRA